MTISVGGGELPVVASRSDLSAAVALFRSLADPTRLAVVRRLAAGERRVTDLVGELGLAQSTVSAHLGCLRDCGLVDFRAQGRQSFYFLARPELLDLLASAEAVLTATGEAVALCPVYGAGSETTRSQTAARVAVHRRYVLRARRLRDRRGRPRLVTGAAPDTSPVGIALTGASIIIMPVLAWAKRRAGQAMGSRLVVADAAETRLCAWLSVSTFAGLVAFAVLGWTWIDAVAGFVIAGFAINEGREAWEGELVCAD